MYKPVLCLPPSRLTAGRPLRSSSRQLRELRFRRSGRPAKAWASNRLRKVRHTSARRHLRALCATYAVAHKAAEMAAGQGHGRYATREIKKVASAGPQLPLPSSPHRSFHDPCAARLTIFSRHPSGSCSSLSLPCSVCSRVRGAIAPAAEAARHGRGGGERQLGGCRAATNGLSAYCWSG